MEGAGAPERSLMKFIPLYMDGGCSDIRTEWA